MTPDSIGGSEKTHDSAILDVTMGHRGSQEEIARLWGLRGPILNLDLRRKMGNGMVPHLQADSRKLPFRDGSWATVFFDPPFSFHGGKSVGGEDYRRFYTTYGLDLYTSRVELGEYIRRSFEEIHRVLVEGGLCLLKWSESRIALTFPLGLAGQFKEARRWERPSKHFGTKTGTHTWYVWLTKGEPQVPLERKAIGLEAFA